MKHTLLKQNINTQHGGVKHHFQYQDVKQNIDLLQYHIVDQYFGITSKHSIKIRTQRYARGYFGIVVNPRSNEYMRSGSKD